MPTMKPCLWFEDNAEEAVQFYCSVFPGGKEHRRLLCGAAGPWPAGKILSIEFEVAGQQLMAINGGPYDTFNHAISLFVECDNQGEIDALWEQLAAEGTVEECGWLLDKFGVAWQITPRVLGDILHSDDEEKSQAALAALFKMKKIDLAIIEQAAR